MQNIFKRYFKYDDFSILKSTQLFSNINDIITIIITVIIKWSDSQMMI